MANSKTTEASELDKLLATHAELLREHLKLWNTVKSSTLERSSDWEIVEDCIERTQHMYKNCHKVIEMRWKTPKQQAQSIVGNLGKPSNGIEPGSTQSRRASKTKNNEQSTTEPKSKSTAPVSDGGEFFVIDTTPIPPEQLKRKLAEPPNMAREQHKTAITLESRPKKRAKQDSTIKEDEVRRDSFEQQVISRLKSGEEKRQKKDDKKRKRSSEESVGNEGLFSHLEPTQPPGKKRKQHVSELLQKAKENDPTVTSKDIKNLLSKRGQRLVKSIDTENINEQVNAVRNETDVADTGGSKKKRKKSLT